MVQGREGANEGEEEEEGDEMGGHGDWAAEEKTRAFEQTSAGAKVMSRTTFNVLCVG